MSNLVFCLSNHVCFNCSTARTLADQDLRGTMLPKCYVLFLVIITIDIIHGTGLETNHMRQLVMYILSGAMRIHCCSRFVNSNINLLVVLLICQRLLIDTMLITSLYMGFFYPFYLVSIRDHTSYYCVDIASLWDWI